MSRILILGATSAIARACAEIFAQKKYELFLAGREQAELARIANDLIIRYGTKVNYAVFDAEHPEHHGVFFNNVIKKIGELNGVLLAFGYLNNPQHGEEFAESAKVIMCNFTGAVSILNYCTDYFQKKKSGFIIGISSVAGDRGRQANALYGAAKGGLTLYLQALRNRLFKSEVRVITIKPGFVDTPMTFGRKGMFLVASPTAVAKKIVNSLRATQDVVYVPWFWRYIMLIVKLMPEKIFKRIPW